MFGDLVRLSAESSQASLCLGMALKERGFARDADEAFDASIAAAREQVRGDPGSFRSHMNLGRALQARGRIEPAMIEFREVLRLRPDDQNAHAELAYCLKSLGRTDEAIAEYRHAIRVRPATSSLTASSAPP